MALRAVLLSCDESLLAGFLASVHDRLVIARAIPEILNIWGCGCRGAGQNATRPDCIIATAATAANVDSLRRRNNLSRSPARW